MAWTADDFKESSGWTADDFKPQPKPKPQPIKNKYVEPIGPTVPPPKKGFMKTVKPVFDQFKELEENRAKTYVDERGNQKPLQYFPNTTLSAYNNLYEDFISKNKQFDDLTETPDKSLAETAHLQTLPQDNWKKFWDDRNIYLKNKKMKQDTEWVQNPVNVATESFVNSVTLGGFRKGMNAELEKTNPLYNLEVSEAAEQGRINNPEAATIGNLAGYAYPIGIANKALSPVTNATTKLINKGLTKTLGQEALKQGTGKVLSKALPRIAEGAIVGAPVDAAQSIIEEGNASKVPQSVLEGATIGAGFDLLLGGLGDVIKARNTKPVIDEMQLKSNAIDQAYKKYDNGILPGNSIAGERLPKNIFEAKTQPKKTITQQFAEAQAKEPPSTGNELLDATRKKLGLTPTTGNSLLDSIRNKTGITTGNLNAKNPIKITEPPKPVIKPKYNLDIETKIKAAKKTEDVGTLGDYLQGEEVRKLYEPVLDIPIKSTNSKKIVNGALGTVNGKPTILINKNTSNIEDTILEEAAHAMRESKGRGNLGISGIDEAKIGQYESLPYEKSANKMVKHAKTLDKNNPKISGQSGQMKDLGLIKSAKTSEQFRPYVAQNIKGTYEVKGNDQLIRDADALIKTDIERATRLAKSDKINSDISNEVSRQLIQKAQKEGRWNDAIELTEITAKKAMESGRAVQALSLWSKLTPEGMLKYAQQMIDKANANFAKMNPREFEKIKAEYKKQGIDIKYYSLSPRESKMAKIIRLTDADAKYINDQMVKIGNMTDGRPKDIEVAKTLDYISAKIPPSMLQRVSTLQTMAQLLNVKTSVRNVLGNTGFQLMENISDVIGTPIDKLIGAATKERTKFLPSITTQAKGMVKGFKLGLEDAIKGVDTSGVGTQLDLPKRTFRKGFFGALETVMNVELRATDRAFYQSAFDQSLRNQMKAKNILDISKATNEMLEQAHIDGLYKTFQDKNILSNAFSGLKRVLNFNKEFGFGDLILKYPKTPANLLMRGIDYSPLGIAKELFNLGRKGFNQKTFVESLSRATVGSGLMGGAVALYNLGIVYGKKPKDKEAANLMKEVGTNQYTINLSALRRFLVSGLNPEHAKIKEGDQLVNYDWIQPGALPFTAGANIAEQNKSKKVNPLDLLGATIYSLEAGMDTLAEQPLVQNATRFLRGYNSLSESVAGVFKDAPASFVPTFVNQVKQIVDNNSRDILSDEAYGTKESLNKVINKIPGLSKILPERVATTGNNMKTYQGDSNNIFNVFVNPAFVTKYKVSPGLKTVLSLYNETGNTTQFPREAKDKLTFKNKTIDLTKEQQNELQRIMGTDAVQRLDKLVLTPGFNNLTNEKKIKKIEDILNSVSDRSKKILRRNLTPTN